MKNILFNTSSTKAILLDKKTQTRRAVTKFYDISLKNPKKHPLLYKDTPEDLEFKNFQGYGSPRALFYSIKEDKYYCSDNIKYEVGKTVWVREPAKVVYVTIDDSTDYSVWTFKYKADNRKETGAIPRRLKKDGFSDWIYNCKSIPNGCIKEMARIFLRITNIRVERLQDISIEDILEEGFPLKSLTENYGDKECIEKCMQWYKTLWNETAKKGYKWEDNPFVIVYEFKTRALKKETNKGKLDENRY